MRSAFLFSAINNPLRSAQDMSRVAVLRLMPLNLNQDAAGADRHRHHRRDDAGADDAGLGRQRRARFAGHAGALQAALEQGGHGGRGQDTYGTLLACAATLLGDELAAEMGVPLGPDEEREWATLLAAESLPEVEDAKPNYRQCVDQILTAPVKVWRNWRATPSARRWRICGSTRASWDESDRLDPRHGQARHLNMAGFGLFTAPSSSRTGCARERRRAEALQRYGCRAGWCWRCRTSRARSRAPEGTDWQHGAWKDALRQCPVAGVMITTPTSTR
jgi:hypothetical protein